MREPGTVVGCTSFETSLEEHSKLRAYSLPKSIGSILERAMFPRPFSFRTNTWKLETVGFSYGLLYFNLSTSL